MAQHDTPHETFMVRSWHAGPMPGPSSNLNSGHTEQPTPQVPATSVPEPSTLGLMLAVGVVALVFSAVRALRLKK